jgi:putative thiamine transport system substrate-binding protein
MAMPARLEIDMHWLAAFVLAILCFTSASLAGEEAPDLADWRAVETKARGQTVYWNAWAGEPSINAYIAWAGRKVLERHGVKVEHVKLSDTAEAVTKVIAEKAAGRTSGGSVDLIWINGANFAALKAKSLLHGPWVQWLPNYGLLDLNSKAAVLTRDFGIATEGYEMPWDLAQLVFYYDSARVGSPPRSSEEWLSYARANPGRLTYPDVQNFLGATFIKQLLMSLAPDASVLFKAPSDEEFARATAPLWLYFDELNPLLWRRGKVFPANSAELRQLLADGEVDVAFSFNPSEASLAISRGELPDTVRSYVLEGGTIGNASFLAVPFNARSKEGAMVLANFLLSPEAQARKQDPTVWGGHTVLSLAKLDTSERELFKTLKPGVASLSPADLGPALPEPHADWMLRLRDMWLQRYAAQ